MSSRGPSLAEHAERLVFSVLFLTAVVLIAWLSHRHPVAMDWTASGRNTLSAASQTLLVRMPERIHVRAFVSSDDRLREAVRQLLARYQRVHPRFSLEFVNPQREPREAERFGISREGELVVEYRDRRENVGELSESRLSNALARLARLSQGWVAFVTGFGERDLRGGARRDLGQFARHLETLGLRLRPLPLDQTPQVPEDVVLLVVLQPGSPWSREAGDAVADYLDRGGSLLWLSDPGGATPPALTARLGVTPEPGLLVDPTSRLNGQSTPEFILVPGYASHPVTDGLDAFTVFPTATSLEWQAPEGWRARGLAATGLRAWRETGDLDREVRFEEASDVPGPLDLAVALERPGAGDGDPQRVVVFADADFLSNAYLGLGANRDLGSNAVNWLSQDDALVDVPAVMAPDLDFAPDQLARAVIALGAPVLLPLGLFAFGIARWRRRRHL